MVRREGQIRVEYEGRVPAELWEHLRSSDDLRVVRENPLTLASGRPGVVLNRIWPYLTRSSGMCVRRVVLRGGRAA
ncbi:MAG: hypothetical protein K6U08_04655 [Firmicutes bacterium]|nr:hypothetical protein [Bacillota bacterium]